MQIYLQTRGRTTDYAFLGAAPGERWWLEYRNYTSFEKPTILVESYKGEWRCYLSGIPSDRRDSVGTTIRYTIVASGAKGDDVDDLVRMVHVWALDTCQKLVPLESSVKFALDSGFDSDTVEQLLLNRSEASAVEVEELVRSCIEKLADRCPSVGEDLDESWVWTYTKPSLCSAFSNRVKSLLRCKKDGLAALLNLVGSAREVETLLRHGQIAVLVDDPSLEDEDEDEPVSLPYRKQKALERRTIGTMKAALVDGLDRLEGTIVRNEDIPEALKSIIVTRSLSIQGVWSPTDGPKQGLRIELKGQFKWKPAGRGQSAQVFGIIDLGLVKGSKLTGEVTVRPCSGEAYSEKLKFRAEFNDNHGDIITLSAQAHFQPDTPLDVPATLKKGGREIGQAALRIDLLKLHATFPSI